ncbi:MAG: thiamine phosphate synthase [Pseudomonadota bacterium]
MGLKHQAASARKWRTAIRQAKSHFPAHLPPLILMTDPTRISDPLESVRRLPQHSGVIYRHFGKKQRHTEASALRQLCRDRGLVFMIAADPLLALQTMADGVHWPERMLHQARAWRERFQLQTASAHSPRAIAHGVRAGMDAVIYSTVFASQSPSAGLPTGPLRLRSLCARRKIPIYALGGINADTAGRVSTVSGLATVSGLSAAVSDPNLDL